MLWSKVLENWQNGIVLKYPKKIKNSFLWNTSVLTLNSKFKQKFKIDNQLPIIQNYNDFEEYIKKSKNKYAIAFPNLNNDTMLVIPMPRLNKNYATLKDFIDNSSIKQQKEFWKLVAITAIEFMSIHKSVWISVHGFGVSYTHVRISTIPKYYFASELKNE
jgi:hypothetical protein